MKKFLIVLLTLLCFSCSTLTSIFIPPIPKDAIMTSDIDNNWEISNYVDSYGLDLDDKFVQTRFTGTFSNTATRSSSCTGIFRVNDDREVEILIYEYGDHRVNGYGQEDEYYLTVWDASSDEVLVKGSAWLSDDRFHVNKPSKVINAVATHERIRCRLQGGKYSTSTYVFEFDTSGFAPDYQSIFD